MQPFRWRHYYSLRGQETLKHIIKFINFRGSVISLCFQESQTTGPPDPVGHWARLSEGEVWVRWWLYQWVKGSCSILTVNSLTAGTELRTGDDDVLLYGQVWHITGNTYIHLTSSDWSFCPYSTISITVIRPVLQCIASTLTYLNAPLSIYLQSVLSLIPNLFHTTLYRVWLQESCLLNHILTWMSRCE